MDEIRKADKVLNINFNTHAIPRIRKGKAPYQFPVMSSPKSNVNIIKKRILHPKNKIQQSSGRIRRISINNRKEADNEKPQKPIVEYVNWPHDKKGAIKKVSPFLLPTSPKPNHKMSNSPRRNITTKKQFNWSSPSAVFHSNAIECMDEKLNEENELHTNRSSILRLFMEDWLVAYQREQDNYTSIGNYSKIQKI